MNTRENEERKKKNNIWNENEVPLSIKKKKLSLYRSSSINVSLHLTELKWNPIDHCIVNSDIMIEYQTLKESPNGNVLFLSSTRQYFDEFI